MKTFQCLRGKRWSSLLRHLWSTLPVHRGWTLNVVLHVTVRCNLGGCVWWMVAGRMYSVGTCPVECVGLRTSSTGPRLSIVCKFTQLQCVFTFGFSTTTRYHVGWNFHPCVFAMFIHCDWFQDSSLGINGHYTDMTVQEYLYKFLWTCVSYLTISLFTPTCEPEQPQEIRSWQNFTRRQQ